MKKAIVWFRDNLRVHDNASLWHAVHENDLVLPVYIKDETLWEKSSWGNVRMGKVRSQFLDETLRNLQQNLRKRGGNILVLKGNPKDALIELAEDFEISTIYTAAASASDDRLDETDLSEHVELIKHFDSNLFTPDDLPFEIHELPEMFTPFRKMVEATWPVRPVCPVPENIKVLNAPYVDLPFSLNKTPHPKSVLEFKGGENEALLRLNHYIWQTHAVASYKETRNQLLGADYSSKLSPWLANGSLSPKMIYRQVKQYEDEVVANESTYWLIFELLWREYFKMVSIKHGSALFKKGGIKRVERKAEIDLEKYRKWQQGKTGEPFVDANMRELLHTGFMSNRGRQNVASYLVHDLGLDWRLGADWFESQLIDYDPCSNYGNWQYIAGIGNDPRPNRKFNVKRQAEMYDPEGLYQKYWLED